MPADDLPRNRTRPIRLGRVVIGGGAPIAVQTMLKTDPCDVAAAVDQIRELSTLGCDIVRVAVPHEPAARALAMIRREVTIPLVADIHFDSRLAVLAIEAGCDGLRVNPGNLGGPGPLREVVAAARVRGLPIRVGVNAGSLEKDLLERHGGATPEALVESALRQVGHIERLGYEEIKISVKAADVSRTVEAYRQLSRRTQYPLHLGLTEAGTLVPGTVRSSVALGILLVEGIGDTLRVSLTDTPAREVRVGLEILRALNLRPPGPSVISCPTCGRCEVDLTTVALQVESALERLYREEPDGARPVVAVMGCIVNGPGEAREADVALAGGQGRFALYLGGQLLRTVPEPEAVDALLAAVRQWRASRST